MDNKLSAWNHIITNKQKTKVQIENSVNEHEDIEARSAAQ